MKQEIIRRGPDAEWEVHGGMPCPPCGLVYEEVDVPETIEERVNAEILRAFVVPPLILGRSAGVLPTAGDPFVTNLFERGEISMEALYEFGREEPVAYVVHH